MNRLIKVQCYRLLNNVLVYSIGAFLAVVGLINGYVKYVSNNVTGFQAYIYSLADTSFFFLLAVVVYLFIRTEFADRTIHNEIKLGYSRGKMVIARTLVITLSISLIYILYPICNSIGVGIKSGFHNEIDVGKLLLYVVPLHYFNIQMLNKEMKLY